MNTNFNRADDAVKRLYYMHRIGWGVHYRIFSSETDKMTFLIGSTWKEFTSAFILFIQTVGTHFSVHLAPPWRKNSAS